MSDKYRPDAKAEGADDASTLDRRELLQAGAGLGGAALLSGLPAPAIAQPTTPVRLAVGAPANYDFVDPTEIDGASAIELKVALRSKKIGNQPVELRNYVVDEHTGDELVGPTIRLRKDPGKTTLKLEINLINELEEEPMFMPVNINIPHGFNTTNLHTHGLHVSPEGKQDDVLRQIEPKTVGDYAFEIPGDHQAGTFWYHAHKHGSTALQVGSAMAGALIIEGDIDDVPEIRATKEKGTERVFVFQQIPYVVEDGIGRVSTDYKVMDKNFKNTIVNGVPNPKITVKAGQVQRWRFIHAGILETLNVVLRRGETESELLYPIAIDGITLAQPDDADEPIVGTRNPDRLGPGNRMDLLVKLEKAGSYELRNQNPTNLLTGQTASTQPLATIVVTEDSDDMKLPTRRQMSSLQRPADIDRDLPDGQMVVFAQKEDSDGIKCGSFFNVDCNQFGTGAPRELRLSIDEKWIEEKWIVSADQGNIHPFHIHVNPFQVIQIGNETIEPGVWWDTIIVEKNKPVTFVTRYEHFDGRTVLHCHNLLHEDQGMMQLVDIVKT